ncbi:MAG: GntP family permease [Gemmataceae bacterium]
MYEYYPLLLLALGIVVLGVLILGLRINAFLALIVAALLIGVLSPKVVVPKPEEGKPERVVLSRAPQIAAQNFGRTMGQIGILIALATIVGRALMESGAADRIVRSCVNALGIGLAPLALLVSSYVLGIPVFFDTVFLLMAPLAKALHLRTGRSYLLYVTAIAAGASITHSLIPPTPGPITVATALNVDLGTTILVGLVVAAPLALAGLAYGAVADRLWPVPLRAGVGTTLEELETQSQRPDEELPSLFISLLPIALPVVLIGSLTAFNAIGEDMALSADGSFTLGSLLGFIGEKNVALLISAVVSMVIVVKRTGMGRSELAKFTTAALDEAGMILLITSAGGAFGGMLGAAGVGDVLGKLAKEWGVSLLVLGWGLAALLKVSQGSATVAMITTAGILVGILEASPAVKSIKDSAAVVQYLGYHPVYLVMAIGCGSKVGSWMNDSGFWVVCKAGGLTEAEALRSWTLVLATMGIVGLPLTALLAWLLPLV